MSVEIRRAEIGDLLPLREMWDAFHAEQNIPYPGMDDVERQAWTSTLATQLVLTDNQTSFRCFIAFIDGEPAGFCAGELAGRAFGKPRLFGSPHWLYMRPQYRKSGVGRALARVCIQYLASLGLEMIEVVAMIGDMQWAGRGFFPLSVRWAAHVGDALKAIADKDAAAQPNGHDEVPDVPA